MEIDEIVDYATTSPENTNPAVLRSMLSQLNSGGSGGEVFLVNIVVGETEERLDKTWIEIYNAFSSGKSVVFLKDNSSEGWTQREVSSLYSASCSGRDGELVYHVNANVNNYQTNTEDGYPSYSYE